MRIKDTYVHGMNWTEKLKSYELSNYRKYQYDLIAKFIGNNILEVGGGDKRFTKEILKNCKNIKRLISIEPSTTLFNLHKNRFIFPKCMSFYKKDFFELNPKTYGSFDTILFIHVLEHLKDDKKAIDNAYKLLKSKGLILIEVPALPFLYSPHDKSIGHYRRYSKKNMLSLINKKKFKIIDIWFQDFIGLFGSLIYFKLKKIILNSNSGTNLVSKQGRFYDHYIVPSQKFIEKFIRPPIGLSLTVILQKR